MSTEQRAVLHRRASAWLAENGRVEEALRHASAAGEVQARGVEPLLESLTPREHEVLALVTQGRTNRQIAAELYIAVGTVKRHTHSIYAKLGVSDRRQAVAKAIGLGLLRAD